MVQGGNEGTIAPGYGVLYDARRPFEDRLYGEEQRSEVLIATVPAASLLRACPEAERLCAKPVPLSGTVARAIAAFVRGAILEAGQSEIDIVVCLSALLRVARGVHHGLGRGPLFGLIDVYLKANLAVATPAPAIAAKFGIAERTLHRIFADRDTTFERHVLSLRVRKFHSLLAQVSRVDVPIAGIAMQCGFADAAHATRTFRNIFGITPRDFRRQLAAGNGFAR
jgi:AraC-like DNA-binding protein